MSVEFYFEYQSHVVQLPVNPEKLSIKAGGKNTTVDVVSLGEVNLLKSPALKEISFESFIPTTNVGSYVQPGVRIQSPKFYRDLFEAIQAEKAAVKFVVSDLEVDLWVSVEDFEYWWDGSDSDMHYKLSLKEYRTFSAQKLEAPTTSLPTGDFLAGTGNSPTISMAKPATSATIPMPTIGAKVLVTGQLFETSYGDGPGKYESNATRLVDNIKKGRKCPYHVTTLSGGWRGWVHSSSIKKVISH